MITHYVTLKALQMEFDARLRGAAVREIFTQQKNELVLSFGRDSGETSASLMISIDPQFNAIVLREPVARARKNSVDLFPELAGAALVSVTMAPADRTMEWRFDGDLALCVQLFNTIRSNVLLVNNRRIILEAFKEGKELKGTPLVVGRGREEKPFESAPELFLLLRGNGSRTLAQALKHEAPQLGSLYLREALVRAEADGGAAVGDVADDQLLLVAEQCVDLLGGLAHPAPVLYLREGSALAFSPVPLVSVESDEAVTYASVNEGVRDVLRRFYRTRGRAEVKHDLLAKLRSEQERAERRRDAVAKEVREAERSEEYERSGNLLLAHLAEVRKGMREIVVEDFDGTSDVKIALDPTLPPAANAERYFTKAKKAKTARGESLDRLPELERRAERLRALANEFEQLDSTEEQNAFMKENEEDLLAMKLIEPAKGKELPPFRLFTVEGGYEVWVGKSSANNDLLTMKYAKQNDLWFHVRGASGSHTVLKVKGSEPPPKAAVQQAASIAAYYSKMRNAGSVPVAYCERKYVRKPKGAAQGAVMLEREKTVLVKPGLP